MKTRTAIRLTVIMGCTMLLASAAGAQSFRSPQRVDTTLTVDRDGTVSVSIYSGRINVVGGSGSSVRVRGTVEEDELEVRRRAGGVSISLESSHGHGGRAELDISVPVGTNVVLEAFSAPLSIRGVKGEATVEVLSGNVVVSDAVGPVSVESVSGRVDISKVNGDVRAEAVSGSITVADVDGDIEAESVSGRITMSGMKSRTVRAETVSGSIGYYGTIEPMGNYIIKSHSGRITLGLPNNAGATVGLKTFSGSVDSDFPVTLETSKYRASQERDMEFRLGDGKARITLETFSGHVRILRGTTAPTQE